MYVDEAYSRQNDAESDIVVLVSFPFMCVFPCRLYKPSYDYDHYDNYDYDYNYNCNAN